MLSNPSPSILSGIINGSGAREIINSASKRKTTFGGRADLAETYRTAKDLIIKHKVFRICQVAEIDGIKQLTICNLWRIERFPDNAIKTYEFLLDREEWVEVTKLEYWPEIPFWPIKHTKSLDWWRSIVKGAIWKTLVAAGYYALPRYLNVIEKWGHDEKNRPMPLEGQREMTPNKMAYHLIGRYIGKAGVWNPKAQNYKWIDGFLTSESMMSGARALRAAFYEHFLDADVLSAMLVIDYRNASFLKYLTYAKHREGLLKISAEHRNLLPMLPGINPDLWSREDLFSRKLWVKGERKSTAVDRSPFWTGVPKDWTDSKNTRFSSFNVAAGYRWLSKSSSIVVKEWVKSGRKDPAVIINIALANVNVRVPVLAYQHLLRSMPDHRRTHNVIYGVSPRIQHLYRLFLMHCSKLWEEKGFVEVKQWVRANGQSSIATMMDYLEYEGFEQGQPDKQATWPSLVRRSDDWHARIAITNMERELEGKKLLEWTSLVPETVIDDITFTPLNTSREVAVEGYQLHHCVGQYSGWCHSGKYRAFSVKEPDGSRSTLGFVIKGKEAQWDQHLSKYNGSISPAAHIAGIKLTALYQTAIQAGSNVKGVH